MVKRKHGERNHEDLTNKEIGKIFVISYHGKSEKHMQHGHLSRSRLWNCKCECGKEVVLSTTTINTRKHCGCLGSNRKRGEENKGWKGYGEVSGQYMASVKLSAGRRGFSFDLTARDVWHTYTHQGRVCIYSGVPISFKDKTASVDRVNSKDGYHIGNIHIVHKLINIMKYTSSEKEFIGWCTKVAEYSKRWNII